MSLRLSTAAYAGRAAGTASRLLRLGGGTSIAGLVGRKFDPSIARQLAGRLERGTILVCGTNGKTTTSRLLSAILTAAGWRAVHNRAGANLMSGITTALLEERGNCGLFEVDEAVLPAAVDELRPRIVVCLNLFRDQLDRYGELDHVTELWSTALRRLPADAVVVLNADDPRVAALADRLSCRRLFFGLDAPDLTQAEPDHAADSLHCPRCGAPLEFSARYYAHIGVYRCSACALARPAPDFGAKDVVLAADRSELTVGGTRLRTALPGLYNVYNVLAAFAAASAAGLEPTIVRDTIASFSGAFGRTELIAVGDRRLRLLLAKNPVGWNEVLRTVLRQTEPLDLYLALNDKIADGEDVSWIWDVDFELLAGRCRHLAIGGTRGAELAMRLKYAGLPIELLRVFDSPTAAVQTLLAEAPAGSTVYAIPTYTAMLELRAGLVKLGLTKPFWED